MKKTLILLLVLLLVSCSNAVVPEPSESLDTETPAALEELENEGYERIDPALYEDYQVILTPLWEVGGLEISWKDTPPEITDYVYTRQYSINDIRKKGDILVISLESLEYVTIDTKTLKENVFNETFEYTDSCIGITGSSELYEQIPVSSSIVTARRNDIGWDYLSCVYTRYDRPGYNYLLNETEKLREETEKSGKPDLSPYEDYIVNWLFTRVASRRLISSPGDITNYDLAAYFVDVYFGEMVLPEGTDYESFVLQSDVLKILPNMKTFNSYMKLSDYGVFKNCGNLSSLTLSFMTDEDFKNLKTGKLDNLFLGDTGADLVDLGGVEELKTLIMQSWSFGVGGFKNCDNIESLYIYGTKTDPALYSPENFPDIKRIVIDSYRDYLRAVDYSGLKAFNGKGVIIDMQLMDYACDKESIESLKGVKINDLYMSPNYVDFDEELANQLDVKNLYLYSYADYYSEFVTW